MSTSDSLRPAIVTLSPLSKNFLKKNLEGVGRSWPIYLELGFVYNPKTRPSLR